MVLLKEANEKVGKMGAPRHSWIFEEFGKAWFKQVLVIHSLPGAGIEVTLFGVTFCMDVLGRLLCNESPKRDLIRFVIISCSNHGPLPP